MVQNDMNPHPRYAWLDGLVEWDNACCHVSSMAFRYGISVFEGLRAYADPASRELILWQPHEHLSRLLTSQRFLRFLDPIAPETALEAVETLLVANGTHADLHLTVTAFAGNHGQPGHPARPSLAITALERPDYRSDGLDVQVSSWRAPADTSFPQRIKANGKYLTARLASVQSCCDGYDAALLLNDAGKVAEGTSMCFFMVRDGTVVTPDRQSGILESITRQTLISILEADEIPYEERPVDRSELALCSEAFFCGTGWEITPIRSIDRYELPGFASQPITSHLMRRFRNLVSGVDERHLNWRYRIRL